jgi:hypothetical protein
MWIVRRPVSAWRREAKASNSAGMIAGAAGMIARATRRGRGILASEF